MKLLHATDLHGSSKLYDAILQLASVEQPRVVLLGGDLFRNRKPWHSDAERQRAFVDGKMTAWLEELHAAVSDLEVLAIPGNHEWRHAVDGYEALAERGLLHGIHLRHVVIDGIVFYGYGCTPPSVFPTKDYERWDDEPGVSRTGGGKSGYITEEGRQGKPRSINFSQWLDTQPTMEMELERLELPVEGPRVLLAHSPPWNGLLDRMWGDRPIGSLAIRRHLENTAPALSFHGHVHESPTVSGAWRENLKGGTHAFNPGRENSQLAAILVETENPADTARREVVTPTSAA